MNMVLLLMLYISGIKKKHTILYLYVFSCCICLTNYLSSSDLKGLTFKQGAKFKKEPFSRSMAHLQQA